MAFTTLVFAQLFNAFNARSDRQSAFHHLFTNRYLWAALGLSVILQVAVVQLSFLNKPFSTTPLEAHHWLICIGLASIVLWADEAKKLVQRRMRPVSVHRKTHRGLRNSFAISPCQLFVVVPTRLQAKHTTPYRCSYCW